AVTDEIIINEDTVLQFKTYQDKNDNWIDDFSEAFTVNFVTNTGEEIENQVIGWEGTIGLPQLQTLKEENKVFYDWYSDEQLTNVVTNESKVTSDMTLFAKVKSIPEIINTTIEHPITRKDIAIEVQSVLHEQNSDIDKQFNTKVLEEEKERKALKAYNKANNILSEKVEQVTQLHNLGQKKLYLI
ncbi:InlB B-repeat-containing protein, partial [Enterococcus faecalis]